MISYSKKTIYNYYKELTKINFKEFNEFLLRVVLKGFFQTKSIAPIIIGFFLLVLSVQVGHKREIFFPQSNIPVYITFILFQFAIAAIIILICPFALILLFNYLARYIQRFKSKSIFPLKIIVLFITFCFTIHILTDTTLRNSEKILIAVLWLALYFVLINMYLSYKAHNHPLKFTPLKVLYSFLFIALLSKPLFMIISKTSETISYIEVNPSLNISTVNCQLISRNNNPMILESNMIINNPQLFEKNDQGCNIYGNVIRVGFSSDYNIIIKKNIQPIMESGVLVNYYSRLECFSGSCFVIDNIRNELDHDGYQAIFDKKAHEDKLQQMK